MRSGKIISSSIWQILNVGIFSALNIAYLMIMARNVDKVYHGSFAILFVIMLILSMISRAGFGPAIVRREINTEQQISFAFYGSLISGTLFTIIFYLLSPLIVRIYGGGLDLFFVRLSSLYFIFLSIGMVPYALIVKRMHFKKMLVAQCSAFLIGSIGIGYVMAMMGYGFGALVGGLLGFTGLNALFMYLLEPHSVKFDFSMKEGKEVFHFSVGIILSDLLFAGANYIDKLILGKFIPATSIALYEKGQYLTRLPVRIFGNAFDSVIYSVFSNLQIDKSRQDQAFVNSLRMSLIFSVYISTFIYCFADGICLLLLGSNWVDSVEVIKIFSISIPFLMLTKLSDAVLRVHDRLYLASAIKFGFIIAILFASLSIIYIEYLSTLWVITLCYCVLNFVMTLVALKIQKVRFRDVFQNSRNFVLLFAGWIISMMLATKLFEVETRIWPLFFILLIHVCSLLFLIYYFPSFFGRGNMRSLISNIERSKVGKVGVIWSFTKQLKTRL